MTSFWGWGASNCVPFGAGAEDLLAIDFDSEPKATWSPACLRQCQASIQHRCLVLFDYFSFLATSVEGYANKKIK